MTNIDNKLIALAYEVVNLNGRDKQIDFGEGTDYQGELFISWEDGKFKASLTVFSDPITSGLYSPVAIDPPETIWNEEEVSFEAIKIQDVADWLKEDWGFLLIEQK